MKPNNLPSKTCTNYSSNCVVWDGPAIKCINLCKGETVSWAIYNLATELCTIMDQLNLESYDLDCLATNNCAVPDFKTLIQLIITKVCAQTPGSTAPVVQPGQDCPDCTVPLAPYFRYQNPANGDMVVEGQLTDYVQLIGISIGVIVNTANTQGRAITDLNGRVKSLEDEAPSQYELPKIFPVCVANPNTSISLDELAALTEKQVCELMDATGTPDSIFNTIAEPSISNLKNEDALGTQGGKMGSITNWVPDPATMAESLRNAWLTIKDLRIAVKNIQLNCCNSTCNDIEVDLQVTMPTSNTLKFFLTGTIPTVFQNCIVGGTLFKIQDQSGNSINVTIDILTTLNDSNGFNISIAGTPLNVADDFTISATLCLMNTDTNSVCQSVLSYYLVNTIGCPNVVYTPNENVIVYQFNHVSGQLTYSVQLFNSGNQMVATQDFVVTGPISISGAFSGLSPNTLYKARILMTTLEHVKTCPYTIVTTTGDTCPAPQSVTATLSIP